ncbi:hypothetical protein Slin15195_G073270 [Septoria linicola]|uniref:Uncharacterized protein n=1 Tax=Septoria linicola TaxID=215465 RepID=A0A9Q9AVL1_9PEZI|nr:hypothetical protein Slin15195_G073270 [Septoria linicola]
MAHVFAIPELCTAIASHLTLRDLLNLDNVANSVRAGLRWSIRTREIMHLSPAAPTSVVCYRLPTAAQTHTPFMSTSAQDIARLSGPSGDTAVVFSHYPALQATFPATNLMGCRFQMCTNWQAMPEKLGNILLLNPAPAMLTLNVSCASAAVDVASGRVTILATADVFQCRLPDHKLTTPAVLKSELIRATPSLFGLPSFIHQNGSSKPCSSDT